MAVRSTTSRRSTRVCSRRPGRDGGSTLIEMMVALTVTLAVTAGAFTLALSSRGLFELDEARARLNQSLRGSKDFLIEDLRQAGERLGTTFPVIELVRGEDLPGGNPGDPDRLILRRNLADTILRSCRDVSNMDRRIYLAETLGPPPPGCVSVPDSNADGWPDNHEVWHEYRLAHGVPVDGEAAVPAYLYDPFNGQGEFFWYRADDAAAGFIEAPNGQTWHNNYPSTHQCQVYLLEERRYQLANDMLELVVDQDNANPLHLVDGIVDFQLRALFQVPPPPAMPVEPPAQDTLGFGDDWTTLRGVEVTVRGRVQLKQRFIEREWSSLILPRNVLSH